MTNFLIVGRRFTDAEFSDYLAQLPMNDWKPNLVVLHNTAIPSLADRPEGFSESNMQDLRRYYAEVQKWSGGPHLFIDPNGIWVFNPLDRRGTHSPSWNGRSWGVEMLGDYESESFETGNGLLVRNHALAALAAMFRKLGIAQVTDENFKLHREDPKTTHSCPGKNVDKARVRAAVQKLLDGVKVVIYRKGGGADPTAVLPATFRDGTVFADAATLSGAIGIPTELQGEFPVRAFVAAKYRVVWKPEVRRVYLVEL